MLDDAGQLVVNFLSNDIVERNLQWVVFLVFALYFFFSWRREVRDTRRKEAEERRGDQILSMQRIRLTETNLATNHRLEKIDAGGAAPMVSFNLTLANIGDGPLDILCALMCARVLDAGYRPGIGTHGRNVEWGDHRPFYWNERDSTGRFAGLSTTKSMVISADQYMRLAPGAKGVLRRKDAMRPAQQLSTNRGLSLKYQGFVVARGYPLGEIWRQLGGRPPDLLESLDLARLQFRAIARPDLHRWRCVQEALFNLNRLVFRLALEGSAYKSSYDRQIKKGVDEDTAKRTAEIEAASMAQDPLGLLMTPDAWRFFLLHHMEFVDLRGHPAADTDPSKVAVKGNPELQDVTALMETLTQRVKAEYLPDLIVPDDFTTDPNYREARDVCCGRLQHVVASWNRLTQVIEECRKYRITQAAGNFISNSSGEGSKAADDGYVYFIKNEQTHRNLWLAYLREGYLISKPFPRKGKPSDYYDEYDIPEDPRDLEPYVMLPLSLDTTLSE